ncbi:pseudouridylate synthase RPUSD2 [Bombina bombina]|uniref:pseudouridylate synthase RPUSD2 n=1 Tax=Bombina bombina TaxID=8345 RepID=UPI00235AA71B|nr:pseudouridylate synthase RPUSD2 [Bombina bombina]
MLACVIWQRALGLRCRQVVVMSEVSLKRKEPPGEESENKKKKRPRREKDRFVPPPVKRRPGISFGDQHFQETESYLEHGLRKVRPYYFDFETYCKGRWVGKTLRQVFSSEFRVEPIEYYERATELGRLRLNEEPVKDLDIVLKNNDFLRNTVHRHEPPVTAQPLHILVENDEMVVVDKPSSLPVHPCGRFRHNTVIFILGKEHNLKELHTIHRLDRMTSGVLMFAKTLEVSKKIDEQVRERQLEKEYVCRVCGEFPEEEVTCEEPILVVSYKIGVCCVDPKGKTCKTVFQRLSYNGKSSVVKCFPYTGRTHQIRVHLQYLGHPIVNDPIYNTEAWGPNKGKGGHIGKTNDELLKSLMEEHKSKHHFDILDIPEDLGLNIESKNNEGQQSIIQPTVTDCTESQPLVGTETLGSSRSLAVPLVSQETEVKCSNQEESIQGSKDILCGECRIVRPDPSPKDLIMYLHALRYKGTEFEFSAAMPVWAKKDWAED